MNENETYTRIGDYINSRPLETYGQIAGTLGLSRGAIARIARRQGIKRRSGKWPCALGAAIAVIEAASPKPACAPMGEAATPPEESISTASDVPLTTEQTAAAADATYGDMVLSVSGGE